MTKSLERYEPMHGWCNRLLRVDLSARRIWVEPTAPRVPDWLGGRGLAARILWDEYPEPVEPYDPRNPLMFFPGALTGTISPYSGRTSINSYAPQAYPYQWFTRASVGRDWGVALKRAGYDGLIVTGASETPVQLVIQDDVVRILPADDLWGLDAVDTQDAIEAAYGRSVRTLTIGPAGENLSRIATILTGTTSVAGQGGFGAVMGSKRLKAVAVMGSGRVATAEPDRLRDLFKAVGDAVRGDGMHGAPNLERLNQRLVEEGGGKARLAACTASCPTPCAIEYSGVPGCARQREWSTGVFCVGGTAHGIRGSTAYDWELPTRAVVEINAISNRLGINHWDVMIAMVPWLRACQREGLLDTLNGRPMVWDDAEFWVGLFEDMAYRRGVGDALAEGTLRAAHQLGVGVDLMRRYYTGWGYAGHWDGHGCLQNRIVYPFWLVSALHWMADTRDPASNTHGYVQAVMQWGPFGFGGRHGMTWDEMRGIGESVYGRADTIDPLSGYEGKERPAFYHGVRSVMKDVLPTDDQRFPLIYTLAEPDRLFRAAGIEGPDIDAALLRAGTGLDWDTPALERACQRVLQLERANVVRQWGRDRRMDESVLPAFMYDENWVNPLLGERQRLDPERFRPLADAYYARCGWDVATGWPTPERLAALDLADVHAPMVAGAEAARTRLPELPDEAPIRDIHVADPERQPEPAPQP